MFDKAQLLQQLHGRLLILQRGFALQRHGSSTLSITVCQSSRSAPGT
jgi:hypothetical protein